MSSESDEELPETTQPPQRLLSPLPPLFGLLSPLGGNEDFSVMLGMASPREPSDANEQVFIPHQTPLRRSGAAYSPLPDDLAPLEPPARAVSGGEDFGQKRKRRLSQRSSRKKKRKRNLKRRISKTVLSNDSVLRTKREYSFSTIDLYYKHRYERVAEIDERLAKILSVLGRDFFANKTVLDIACGRCAFVAFYIAAYLGASRVVALDKNFDSIMSNLRQLRKFKHDGIRLETSASSAADQYPAMLVKRSGPVCITNKPWRVLPQYSCSKEQSKDLRQHFPFNIEFRMTDVMSQEQTDIGHHDEPPFDVILVLGYILRQAFVEEGTEGIRKLFSWKKSGLFLVENFHWRDIRKHVDKENVAKIRVSEFLTNYLGLTIVQRITPTLLLLQRSLN